ncbi:MAG: toprim domain-containing protein [Candidatus Pacebacteria bacterium]|nr:toprim domain-containing protein [Candidatus Paceibacterota bacterium]
MILSKKIKEAVDRLASLPGIGPRQAIRLAFFLSRSGREFSGHLSEAIRSLGETKVCESCFFIHENNSSSENFCEICSDTSRLGNIIALVEKETDLLSLEKTGKFKGRYLVLGDLKKNGVLGNEERRRIEIFKNRVKNSSSGKLEEIILALSPTSFGDFNASMLEKELSGLAKKITRLGRGIPTGGEIEFADEETLSHALENRS